MFLLHLVVLAVVQGLTEFLPVSSSGHLILVSEIAGAQSQGLVIDVAVHVGTLGAVILYFWSDVRNILAGIGRLVRGRVDTSGAFMALCLGIATVPIILVGFVLHVMGWIEYLRSVTLIGWTMLIFGIVLYWTDRAGTQTRTVEGWRLRDAAIMGVWQVVALIPGTSRSGIVISAARHLGYTRRDAARLAMLMSIPTILSSGVLLSVDLTIEQNLQMAYDAALAAFLAFLAALLSLGIMMRLLQYFSYTPYVVYRMVLGVVLLMMAYSSDL
ncbi:MAG: undecaprenyl-diphosphate phosphatase [Aestuariivita sp.]|nr:undecaprenyl-diphosphate phosphatase [Aestuariivita sp.]